MNAVMIMCHKNIDQVLRLASTCSSPETVIILHIDKKYSLSKEKLDEISQMEQVFLTDERFSGELDTRSLVDIAMCMVKKAKAVEQQLNIHFDYYLLLSGQDYLIKPIGYINEALQQAYPAPLIDCTPYAKDNWIYHKFAYAPLVLSLSSLVDADPPRLHSLVRLFLKVIRRLVVIFVRLFHLTDYHRLTRFGISLYGGSAWWILPDLAIDYILSEYEKNPQYVAALLKINTPEEVFFQTMVMRSPVKQLVHINPTDMTEQNCKTWAYFSDDGKPFKGHPYIFTVQEYDKLVNHDAWIARKFDDTVDREILDLLDRTIKNDKE